MKDNTLVLDWAANHLISTGHTIISSPQIVAETPWSTVIRFVTANGDIYLKQTPPSLFLEVKIIELLAKEMRASVPTLLCSNKELNCFLMQGAGISLREYLKTSFKPELLCQAINEFVAFQRSTEHYIDSFLAIGVPDWRLDNLCKLYDHLIQQRDFLKTEGLTDEEIQNLHALKPQLLEQCNVIAQYQIPATIVQTDFNTNNIVVNLHTGRLTSIDLGEVAISHPFFSLNNFLFQATLHHGVKEQDQFYLQLQETCMEAWLGIATKNQLLAAMIEVKKLWYIYFALAYYRLMQSVEINLLKSFYANRPNQIALHLRKYISANLKI